MLWLVAAAAPLLIRVPCWKPSRIVTSSLPSLAGCFVVVSCSSRAHCLPLALMASLGQLVLVAGLAFLVLSAQDQGHGGPAGGGGGPAIGAAAAAAPPAREFLTISQHPRPPLSSALAESKRGPIPQSGPSDRWNYEVNHEEPSSSAQSGGRRTRTIDGRRLGSP